MDFLTKWASIEPQGQPIPMVTQHKKADETAAEEAVTIQAVRILNLAGVRVWKEGKAYIAGLWSDLDFPEVRAALSAVGMGNLPVRHLDSADVPAEMKGRNVPERAPGMTWAQWEAVAVAWRRRDLS